MIPWWVTMAWALQPMAVRAVDAAGAPVPCVTLRTVHQVVAKTDDDGVAAFVEPGLVGQTVWLDVLGAGQLDPDFFGYEGVAVPFSDGGFRQITVRRRANPPTCEASDRGTRLVAAGLPVAPMRIEVTDPATGRGVPLARVESTARSWVTDSAGNIAVLDPILYGTELTLQVADWRGYGPSASAVVTVAEGDHLVLEAPRAHPAERLYRLTGADPYRDTELLGLPTPVPALQGEVVGQDSNLAVHVDGQLLWMWGDTQRPSYPLGHFDMAAAWVPSPEAAEAGQPLDYFVDGDGFSRGIADLSDAGPVWMVAPAEVDDGGTAVMVAVYGVYAGLVAIERGVARYDVAAETFVPIAALPLQPDISHQTAVVAGGWVVMHEGLRYGATLAEAADPSVWQVWSPDLDGAIDRHPDGTARWAWRPGLAVPDNDALPLADQWPSPRDPATGDPIDRHLGSVVYSPWRNRYVHIFTRDAGFFSLGQIWMSEADTPLGPWSYARQLAEHDAYTTYNPMPNPALGDDDQQLFFQATYTHTFGTDPQTTPRYDYNQLMYRVDLDHLDVRLPTPVYAVGIDLRVVSGLRAGDPDAVVAFHAHDRAGDGLVGIGVDGPSCGERAWVADPVTPRFWVAASASPGLVPLVRALHADGTDGVYVDGTLPANAITDGIPLGWAWPQTGPPHTGVSDWLPEVVVDGGPDHCAVVGDLLSLDAGAASTTPVDGTWSWWQDGLQVGSDAVLAWTARDGDAVLDVRFETPRGAVWSDTVWVHATAMPAETSTEPCITEPTSTDPNDLGPGATGPPKEGESKGCGCRGGATPYGLLDVVVALVSRRDGRTRPPGFTAALAQ